MIPMSTSITMQQNPGLPALGIYDAILDSSRQTTTTRVISVHTWTDKQVSATFHLLHASSTSPGSLNALGEYLFAPKQAVKAFLIEPLTRQEIHLLGTNWTG